MTRQLLPGSIASSASTHPHDYSPAQQESSSDQSLDGVQANPVQTAFNAFERITFEAMLASAVQPDRGGCGIGGKSHADSDKPVSPEMFLTQLDECLRYPVWDLGTRCGLLAN